MATTTPRSFSAFVLLIIILTCSVLFANGGGAETANPVPRTQRSTINNGDPNPGRSSDVPESGKKPEEKATSSPDGKTSDTQAIPRSSDEATSDSHAAADNTVTVSDEATSDSRAPADDTVTVSGGGASAKTSQRKTVPTGNQKANDPSVDTSTDGDSVLGIPAQPSGKFARIHGQADEALTKDEKFPVVATPHGRVKGRRVVVNDVVVVNVFMGLPFATVERWREPKPLAQPAWEGERDATQPGPACSQYGVFKSTLDKGIRRQGKPLPTAEDCLFLNVYTPTPKNGDELSTRRWPVMVWIHGGAFVEGTGSVYDGEALAASGDVVVVTINYRLGVFGFLQLAPGQTANFGLLDQLAALDWVKHHIKWYGGDERKVTIFGESAGGASVGWLLLSAKTPVGLFKRAIMQSGTPNSDWAWRSSERALADTGRLAESLHCDVKSHVEACLRGKDTDTLLDAHFGLVDRSVWTSAPAIELFDASPVIDGHVITDTPSNLLLNRPVLPADEVMVGFTQHEMTFFHTLTPKQVSKGAAGFSQKEFEQFFEERLLLSGPNPVGSSSSSTHWHLSKNVLSAVRRVVEYEYADTSELTGSGVREKLRDLMFDMWSDVVFTCPSLSILNQLSKRRVRTFAYIFTHVDGHLPAWAKAGHMVELDYVFGMPILGRRLSVFDPAKSKYMFSAKDKQFSQVVMSFWSSFADTGAPTARHHAESVFSWPVFTSSSKDYLLLDTTLSMVQGYREKQCLFWLHQLPQLLSVVNGSQSVASKMDQQRDILVSSLLEGETPRNSCPSLSSCDSTSAKIDKQETECAEHGPKSTERIALLMFSCLAAFWLITFLVQIAT